MKLNPDCIRDLLMDIEEHTDLQTTVIYNFEEDQEGRLSKYSADELEYHLKQCDLSGYLIGYNDYSGCDVEVGYLSPQGHAFLSDIRSDTVWKHTKAVAGKIGAWSMDTLKQIAIGVVSEMVKDQLGRRGL